MSEKYGPNSAEVEAFIANIKKITPEQYKKYISAYGDAYETTDEALVDASIAYSNAYDAVCAKIRATHTAAYGAIADVLVIDDALDEVEGGLYAYGSDDVGADVYSLCWIFRNAATVLAFKTYIGQYGFTQVHYNTLTEVCLITNPKTTLKKIQTIAYKTNSKFTLKGLAMHPSITEELKVLIAMRLGSL